MQLTRQNDDYDGLTLKTTHIFRLSFGHMETSSTSRPSSPAVDKWLARVKTSQAHLALAHLCETGFGTIEWNDGNFCPDTLTPFFQNSHHSNHFEIRLNLSAVEKQCGALKTTATTTGSPWPCFASRHWLHSRPPWPLSTESPKSLGRQSTCVPPCVDLPSQCFDHLTRK